MRALSDNLTCSKRLKRDFTVTFLLAFLVAVEVAVIAVDKTDSKQITKKLY
jgi:hypothetical protein